MRFARSAFRHGITEADIRHVLANSWRETFDDDGFEMVFGLDRRGRLIEVGVLTADDGETIVIHAMPARPKYQR